MSGFERLLTGRALVDRYRIEEVIGRGGFAAVYRATDQRLGRTVAVKVMTVAAPDADARDRLQARFNREARVAASLQHPNVATVYDFGTDPELELDFLVMELLQGEDLAARLARSGAPPLEEALRILRDAARGIAAGHHGGLIHRDVKPGNIFLAMRDRPDSFRVCVLDFGIARFTVPGNDATPLTRGAAPHSPGYASPEQLQGGVDLTPASDVFSLGVVAYHVLSGERPFAQGEIAHAASLEALPPLGTRNPAVPPAVEAVVQRALAYAPEDRFPDAQAMADALDEAYEKIRGEAPQPAALPAPVPIREAAPALRPAATPVAPRPQRASPVLLAGVPLVIVALLMAWWAQGRDEPEPRIAPESPALAERPAAGVPAAQPLPEAPEPRATPGQSAPVQTAARTPAPPAASPVPAARPSSGGGTAAGMNREGEGLFERGNNAAAVERFRRAVQMAPANAYYRNNLGWALFQANQVEAAARELEEVVRINPRRDIAHANLGEVRHAQGDIPGAIAAYERFLELNTDPRRERIAREKLRRLRGE
ncbi:hypothetical protein BH23GEM5_BH23GEM5_28850 [soil metagenome]